MNLLKKLVIKHFPSRHPDGFSALILNILFFNLAFGMLSTFGVLFIYELGGTATHGVTLVFLFYFCQRVVTVLAIYPIGVLVSRLGYRYLMLVGTCLLIIRTFLLTQVSPESLVLLLPALAVGGIYIAAYYLGFHALFLDDNDDRKIGEQMGILEMIKRTTMIISPFIAGFVTQFWGFDAMFDVAIILLVISIVPLMQMKHHKKHVGVFSMEEVKKQLGRFSNVFKSFYFWSITDGVQSIFWPIFLFLILGSYVVFGIFGSAVMIFNSLATVVAGRIYDKRKSSKMFLSSAFAVAVSWVGRFIAPVAKIAIGSDVVNRVFSPLWWMKIRRQELAKGETFDSLVFAAVHEYIFSASVFTGLLLGYFILKLGWGQWQILGISMAALVFVATYFVKDV